MLRYRKDEVKHTDFPQLLCELGEEQGKCCKATKTGGHDGYFKHRKNIQFVFNPEISESALW